MSTKIITGALRLLFTVFPGRIKTDDWSPDSITHCAGHWQFFTPILHFFACGASDIVAADLNTILCRDRFLFAVRTNIRNLIIHLILRVSGLGRGIFVDFKARKLVSKIGVAGSIWKWPRAL